MPRHLIETTDFSKQEIQRILDLAEQFLDGKMRNTLKDHIIITIFFENSTRTLSSFEVATKRLGGSVVRLDVSRSSTSKGETLFDTAANLNAMSPSAIIVRHKSAGVPNILSRYVSCSIVNGGDGAHAHPTQALLDLLTLKKHLGNLEGKKIAIVGDIKSSRVANSNIELLSRFGMEVILIGPPHFIPKNRLRHHLYLKEVIDEVDAVMSLRTQTERHNLPVYSSLKDYANDYCITKEILGDRDIILLHPGPVHRNIDISDEMLKDPRCKVLEQVTHGVAIRMAVLETLITQSNASKIQNFPYF
ncbi:aspartate carbamoyltransferase catalytic subunit [Helicobacter canadensis]|uniref:Aspartate carbamoyltransferase n=1 Tax=Helicobacter canadensis MIT 98-5491 TaxID=537970 RepID=C5ZX90_9HELI|nr:aspartate carbamoyltransferase catalytic subunit [Helicobacter canadensis]EES89758.1 aspartate carbamoyltransferase catalytic subunit [Helicobacter canadensis MIT 98-5491]EFR48552.1 aspartate carbamoyltransferase [Helicobacter canadensis MIT 98-5491]STO99796.1 aspartate carbamoyltransferase [Helicobacter canadensis]